MACLDGLLCIICFSSRHVVRLANKGQQYHRALTQSLFSNVLVSCRVRRWFEAPAGTTLFYVTKDPLDPSEFEETVDGEGSVLTRWGRSTVIEVGNGLDLWLPLAGQPFHSGAICGKCAPPS